MVLGKIIGLDPGSTTLGVAVLNIELNSKTIHSSRAFTLNADKSPYFTWMNAYRADRIQRLSALKQHLYELFVYEQPFLVGCESPFFNRFRPNAYGVLMETLTYINQAYWDYNPYANIHLVDPPTAKKAVGVMGKVKSGESKTVVRDALANLSVLNLQTPIETLDEHSVDAVAVAYSTYKHFLGVLYA